MNDLLPYILVAILMGFIWYQQRTIRLQAWRQGAIFGFMLGMDRTIKIMAEKGLARDLQDNPISKEQLMIDIAPVIVDDVTREVERVTNPK